MPGWGLQITVDTLTPGLRRLEKQLQAADGHGIDFGATAEYSVYNEFGTSKMSAAPFIRPAFDANQQKFLNAIALGVLNGNMLAEIAAVGADMVDMARSLARVKTGFMRDSVYYQVI